MFYENTWILFFLYTLILFSSTFSDKRHSPLLASRKRIGNSRTYSDTFSKSDTPLSIVKDNFRSQPTINTTDDGLTVSLTCRRDRMQLDFDFKNPFRGVIGVGQQDSDNTHQKRACQIRGNGSSRYQMDISHLNCGTHFNDRLGHFSNSLFVRHHPTLETGADHSKTLVCKFDLAQFNVT